jgi:uncharacterized membrane protein YukC
LLLCYAFSFVIDYHYHLCYALSRQLIAVSKTILRHYICKNIEGVDYLFADLTQVCYTDQWKVYAYVGIALIIIYPVGIPLFLFYKLWMNRHLLDQNRVKAELGFLYEGYKQGFWWFEVVS